MAEETSTSTLSNTGPVLTASDYNKDGKSDIWVSVSIQQIFDIDTASETFGLDTWINCLYFDPKIQSNSDKHKKGGYIDPTGDIFEHLDYDYFPVFHILNNRDFTADGTADVYFLIYDEPAVGSMLIARRYTGHYYK